MERIFLLGAVFLVCGSLKNNFKTHTPRMLADSHETTMFFENQDDKKKKKKKYRIGNVQNKEKHLQF